MASAKQQGIGTTSPVPEGGHALTVRTSHIRVPGTVRVNESVRADLGVENRETVAVHHGRKSVALHLFGDRHVAPGHVVLRRPDMERLGVRDGESVVLVSYPKGRAALKGAFSRVGARLGRRLDLTDVESKEE